MKFYTCVCLFDCYAYLCNVKSKEHRSLPYYRTDLKKTLLFLAKDLFSVIKFFVWMHVTYAFFYYLKLKSSTWIELMKFCKNVGFI